MSYISDSDFVSAVMHDRNLDLLISQLGRDQLVEFEQANQSLDQALDYTVYQQGDWLIPAEYQQLDLLDWLMAKCTTDQERERVAAEWLLYEQKGLVPVLRTVKYLVDTMRANNLVWGVGRGSSVASFVLYLMGVHKVNSIKWDLDPAEFLR